MIVLILGSLTPDCKLVHAIFDASPYPALLHCHCKFILSQSKQISYAILISFRVCTFLNLCTVYSMLNLLVWEIALKLYTCKLKPITSLM